MGLSDLVGALCVINAFRNDCKGALRSMTAGRIPDSTLPAQQRVRWWHFLHNSGQLLLSGFTLASSAKGRRRLRATIGRCFRREGLSILLSRISYQWGQNASSCLVWRLKHSKVVELL